MKNEQGPKQQIDSRVTQSNNRFMVNRWFHSPMRRRQVLQETGFGIVGAAVGYLGGQELQHRQEKNLEANDPIEIQIHRLELKNKEGLGNKDLRDQYTWLLAFWYANGHSYSALSEPDDEYGSAKLFNAVSYITDKSDDRLKGQENIAGWAIPRVEIVMNLTDLTEPYFYRPTGGVVTPLMQYRDILIHEFTHFITKEVRDVQVFDVIKDLRPELVGITDVKGFGFRVYFDSDPENPEIISIQHLKDFDEASTELIANYFQRTAGLATGIPTYPEADQTLGERSRIEKTLDTLEAILKLVGISIERFAELHKDSDLEGLAMLFADATDKTFTDDREKINYGLEIIDALRTTDKKFLGEYISSVRY